MHPHAADAGPRQGSRVSFQGTHSPPDEVVTYRNAMSYPRLYRPSDFPAPESAPNAPPKAAERGPCAVYVAPRDEREEPTVRFAVTERVASGRTGDSDVPTDRSLTSTETGPSSAAPSQPKPSRPQTGQATNSSLAKPSARPEVVTQLLQEVEEAARNVDRKLERLQKQFPMGSTRQVNCLLVGRPGNGKSSLINSIYQTIAGRSDKLCDEGKADSSCTIKYACSPALCVQKALPLILFDTKGLPDSKDRSTRAMLQNLFRGKFKPDHSMNNPRFQDCYFLPQKSLQIDVAVFVYAYGSVFPHRLASALHDEAVARGVTVIPVITFYDQVEHDDQLDVHLDCCRRTFNTYPLYLANLSAYQGLEKPMAVALSKQAVVDVASQLMVYGQQHQRFKKLDVSQPVDLTDPKDCAIM